jgi:hypothetical protein
MGSRGAQRASIHRGLVLAIAAASLATLIAAPSVLGATSVGMKAGTSLASVPYASPTWLSAEQWYLGLLNCTRTGGWVLADGTCRGYGSGRYSAYVRPLSRSAGISDHVARPYARLLATRNLCSHTALGDPGYRLRLAGFLNWNWAENIGCRWGYTSVRAAILASHRAFQAEKSTNGGHWQNIKNSRLTTVGIGVWKYGTQVRLVTDFYRP